MATKNYSAMTTKKLIALLATASIEDRTAIEAILEARNQKVAKATEAAEAPAKVAKATEAAEAPAKETEKVVYEAELTDEEKQLAEAMEKKATAPKITDAERTVIVAECKKNVNHKCEVVPFNTAEWVEGIIIGVIEEKRSNKVLYAIRTAEGKRIVKVYDSTLIRILDEVVEPVRKQRAHREATEATEWTPEAIDAAFAEVVANVGKLVAYTTGDAVVNESGEEEVPMEEGRITAIVPDKRSKRMLYRIEVAIPNEVNENATKFVHKVSSLPALVIATDFDDKGKELNEKYLERRDKMATRVPVTPEGKVLAAEEALKKAEETLKKAQEAIEARAAALLTAKKELDEYLVAKQDAEQASETSNDEKSLA